MSSSLQRERAEAAHRAEITQMQQESARVQQESAQKQQENEQVRLYTHDSALRRRS